MTSKPAGTLLSGAVRQAKKNSSTKFPTGKSAAETKVKTASETNEPSADLPNQTDADVLLKADHRKVEKLFQEYESAEGLEAKKKLSHQICMELIVHTELEEELFYPACRTAGVEDDLLDEAQVEHDGAKVLITQLITLPAHSAFYDAKVKVLSEYIKSHVGEEERSSDGIFAKARHAGVDMSAVGKNLQSRKAALLAQGQDAILRPPIPRSLEIPDFINHSFKENPEMTNHQNRDDQGRFTQDGYRDSSSGRYASGGQDGGRYGNDQTGGRSASQSDDRNRNRDDSGRFSGGGSDGYDDRYGRDDSARSSSGRSDRGSAEHNDNYSSNRQGRGQGQGWYGDSEGHSQAARRGNGNYSDDHDGYRNQGGRDRGGSDSNLDASRREYQSSGRGDYGDRDDHRSSGNQGGSNNQGRSHGGWFGDSEGHSEAARRGHQSSGLSDRGNYEGGGRDNDQRSSGNQGGRSNQGQGHGGWFGDSEGHSEAARRGWENRQ